MRTLENIIRQPRGDQAETKKLLYAISESTAGGWLLQKKMARITYSKMVWHYHKY